MVKVRDIHSTISVSRPKIAREDPTIPQDQPAPFHNHTRFVMLLLVTLCLSITQSNVLTLMFTVICMQGNVNETIEGVRDPYAYSADERKWLFSIVAIGAIVAMFPVMLLVERFGSRFITTFMGIVSCVSTALLPLFASWGYEWLLPIRFIQGTGLSVAFTLIGIFTRQWSMQKQNAFFIAFLTTFFQLGPIFTMPVAGALCSTSLGWPSVYYLHAIVTAVLFVLFYYFYRETPNSHKFVTDKELDRIRRQKNMSNKREPIPYKAMLMTNAVWAVWIAAVGNFMGIQVTMQYAPTFLNKVLKYPVEASGYLAAIPQIVTFVLKMFAGVLSDRMDCVSLLWSVRIFNSLAIGGMGIFFFILAAIPTDQQLLSLIVLICCTSIVGFNCGAFFRASAFMAAQHNHFVMSVSSMINCISALLCPIIVGIFEPSNEEENDGSYFWQVWLVFGVVLFITNIYFCIFGKVEPAEWTKTKIVTEEENPPVPIENSADAHTNTETA